MSVPGSNLLNQAFKLIAKQKFKYYNYLERKENEIGYDVNTYGPPIPMTGSLQPVPRNMYEQYGLDFNKKYVTVYISNSVIDVDRDRSSDQIQFNGEVFQATSTTPWEPIDGWTAAIFVKVPPDAGQCAC